MAIASRTERITPLTNQQVYPHTEPGRLRTWVGVGGSPNSVVRAANYGLPLVLAIIGGNPLRFRSFVDRYHALNGEFGNGTLPVGAHCPGHVAPSDTEARDGLWPHYATMHARIGRERGWPPASREQFEANCDPDGALFVGSPATVAAKINRVVEGLGLNRFAMKYSAGSMPHESLLRSIELFATEVAPQVRARHR